MGSNTVFGSLFVVAIDAGEMVVADDMLHASSLANRIGFHS